MSKNTKTYQEPTHEEIANCAQRIYELEGRPQGKATEHWLQAEAQLIAERKAAGGSTQAKNAGKTPSATQISKQRDGEWQTPGRQQLHTN